MTVVDAIVTVPVKNEVAHIGDCLRALDAQQGGHAGRVVLLLNDCTDGTAELVRALRPALAFPVEIVERRPRPGRAGAGFARGRALEYAARLAPGAALMTTDADGRVEPDWIAANLRALRDGADAVFGQAIIDPIDARMIPQTLHDADARECQYATLLDHIAALLDPDPADPWPRHSEHSGASIAVTASAYRRSGGVPAVAVGEDRDFFAALRRMDARIRHAPGIRVTVSGRIHGRAEGGMADTIRRRMMLPDPLLDDRLEPAAHAARRAWLRQRLRRAWHRDLDGEVSLAALAVPLQLSPALLRARLDRPCFGMAMELIEAASPRLRRLRVRTEDLPAELRRARRILRALAADRFEDEAHPAGTPISVPGLPG